MKYTKDDRARQEESGQTFTVEEAVEAMGFGRFQMTIFFVAGIINAVDALEMMSLPVLSPVLRCEWYLSDTQVALVTTAVFVGMGVSAPVIGLIGDKYGRKAALLIVTLSVGYFGFLAIFSPSYGWMVCLRGLVGVGLGGSPQGSSLLAEYLPSKYRAKILLTNQVFWATGSTGEILLASWIIPHMGWRWLMAFSSIPVIVAVVFLIFIPESCRYLVAAGRFREAVDVLKRGAELNSTPLPEGRLVQPSQNIKLGQPRDLFSKEYLRSTLQIWFLWFGTAFSYYGMILISSQVLTISSAKRSTCKCAYLTHEDYVTMILATFGEFACIPLNVLMIDRLGRRKTGAVNWFFCGLFFGLLQLRVSRGLLTFFMFAARAFSAATFSWVYLYSVEVLLNQSKSAALSVYVVVCALCCATAFLLPVETKGRALPQFVEMDIKEQ